MHANRRTNVKVLAAVIGGSAVVAAGAVTMAITQEPASSTNLSSSGMRASSCVCSCANSCTDVGNFSHSALHKG